MGKIWESVYIYYADEGDIILKELVIPYLDKLQECLHFSPAFFFIRYFEQGYHIRLRIELDRTEKKMARALLNEMLACYHAAKNVDVSLKYSPYEPEVDRYGNTDTIKFAEQQFAVSTKAVLKWLASSQHITLSERYLQALKLHLAFFVSIALSSSKAQLICDQFIAGWLPRLYAKDTSVALQCQLFLQHFESEYLKYEPMLLRVIPAYGDLLAKPDAAGLDSYLLINKTVFSAYKAAGIGEQKINAVLGSFMHMTNNRLGIANSDEAFIIYLVKKSLNILYRTWK